MAIKKFSNSSKRIIYSDELMAFALTNIDTNNFPKYAKLVRGSQGKHVRLRLKWKETSVAFYKTEQQITENLLNDIAFIKQIDIVYNETISTGLNFSYTKLTRDFSVESNFTETLTYSEFNNIEDMLIAIQAAAKISKQEMKIARRNNKRRARCAA